MWPCVLERAHPLERDRPADVDVGRGDVDPELHPQRPAELQLLLEAARRQDVDGVPGQTGDIHGGLHYPGSGALSEKVTPSQAAAHPQAQTPCPPRGPLRAGHGVLHRRSPDRGRCQDPATRPLTAADAGEHLRLRRERPHRAHDPARVAGADHRPVAADLAVAEARDRRDRGQALLRAPRRRPPRHGTRALGRRLAPRHRAGRLDDHAAVRQERLSDEPADRRPQADRGGARLAARAEVVEGQDPHRVPEHGLLRKRRLRRRAGEQDLLPPQRGDDEAGRGGAARGDPRGPEPLGPGRAPERWRGRAATSCCGSCTRRATSPRASS